MTTVLRWNDVPSGPSLRSVPSPTREDKLFKERIALVLRELRAIAGWTQEEAAEHIGVPTAKLGRWERATHPPKGYDLGRAFRAYEPFGARWEWFFDPPEVVVTNPIRDHLLGLVRGAAVSAHEDLAQERAQHRVDEARRDERRDKRPA